MGWFKKRKAVKKSHKKSKTGSRAYCTTCDKWYNLNSRRQFKKHTHK